MTFDGMYKMLSTYVKEPGFTRDIKSMVMGVGAELMLNDKQRMIKLLSKLVDVEASPIETASEPLVGENLFFKKEKKNVA
jgi:hypothetical protein